MSAVATRTKARKPSRETLAAVRDAKGTRAAVNRAGSKSAGSKSAPSSPGGGKSAGELVRSSNRWRDNYNPLRSLVISRVVSMIEAAERGDYAELQLTLRKVEKRFPVLKALIARRTGAIEKLTWDVKVPETLPEGATPEMAEVQRKHLRACYDKVTNLTDAFGQLVLAEFRGYAILQKHRYQGGPNDGAVRELHWLPQDTWARNGQFGDWYYNLDSRFGLGLDSAPAVLGEDNRIGSDTLPRADFVIREVDAPLYEIALLAFINWLMGRKDHAAFVEIFGLPNSVVILPPNIKPGEEGDYRTAAEKVADGISGALPNGSDVKFPTASVRGNAPFKEFCDAQDADVVLAGTGGLLTMLSLPTGIGQGASGEHGDAFADIALADARRISATLQTDFDGPELDEAFPGQPRCAYFELAAQDEEDINQLVTNTVALKGAGYVVKSDWLAERTGYELDESAAPAPGAPASGPATQRAGSENGAPLRNRLLNSDLLSPISDLPSPGAVRTALADDLQHALRMLREGMPAILAIEDATLREARLGQLVAKVKRQVTTAPAGADALADLLTAEMAKGLAAKPSPTPNSELRSATR